MKFVVILAFVAAAAAGPVEKDAVILRLENDVQPEAYSFSLETSNDIKQQEQGQLQNVGTDNEAISVRGSYSYVGPDNKAYSVNYVADENGFQPVGDHLPVAP